VTPLRSVEKRVGRAWVRSTAVELDSGDSARALYLGLAVARLELGVGAPADWLPENAVLVARNVSVPCDLPLAALKKVLRKARAGMVGEARWRWGELPTAPAR